MIPQAKKQAVIEMLSKGKYSLRKISMKTGVSWGIVKAYRDDKQKAQNQTNPPITMQRKAKPRVCPECGARVAVWPCIKCNPDHFRDHITLHPNIYKDMSTTQEAKEQLPALLCLINDLQELATLNEIDHPLFISLVNRSREIFKIILKDGKKHNLPVRKPGVPSRQQTYEILKAHSLKLQQEEKDNDAM